VTTIEACLWFVACWSAGSVLFAAIWCSTFTFNTHDDSRGAP
jgi:hypothetical protein